MMGDRTLAFLAVQVVAATLGVSVILTACQGNPAHEASSSPSLALLAGITTPTPAISPTPGPPPLVEATRILFFSYATEDRATSLYLANTDGSEMACLDEIYDGDFGSVGPISPDGTKVAYTGYADTPDYKHLVSLYTMNIDEGDPKLVVDLTEKLGIDIWTVQQEGWSRDGKQIYIDVGTSDDTVGTRRMNIHSLYAVSLDGSQITEIMQVRSLSFYSAFQLSPDREQILTVKSTKPDGKSAAFIGAMDGSDLQQVPDTLQAEEASWSPDGKRIAITRLSEASGLELIVEDIDGGHKVTLDKDMLHAYQVTWSPDGTKIAYDRHPGAVTEYDTTGVWVASADGGVAIQLTHSPRMAYSYSTEFAWSPDGKWIAYDAPDDSGEFKIFIIGASGGKPRPVIDFIGKQSFAAWLP